MGRAKWHSRFSVTRTLYNSNIPLTGEAILISIQKSGDNKSEAIFDGRVVNLVYMVLTYEEYVCRTVSDPIPTAPHMMTSLVSLCY